MGLYTENPPQQHYYTMMKLVDTVVCQLLPLHTLVTPLLLAPLSTVLLPLSVSPLPQPSLPLNHTLSTPVPRLQLLLNQLNNMAMSSSTRYIIFHAIIVLSHGLVHKSSAQG